jgi:hypothetical protein
MKKLAAISLFALAGLVTPLAAFANQCTVTTLEEQKTDIVKVMRSAYPEVNSCECPAPNSIVLVGWSRMQKYICVSGYKAPPKPKCPPLPSRCSSMKYQMNDPACNPDTTTCSL